MKNLMRGVVTSTDRAFGRGAVKVSEIAKSSGPGVRSMRRDDSSLFSAVQPKLMVAAEPPLWWRG
jgi:hypothetical protein